MRRLLGLFRAGGYAPLLAASTADALALLSTERFDVVVVDDGNPSMSAEAFARHVQGRLRRSAPPIVHRTGAVTPVPNPLFAAVVSRSRDPLDLLWMVERVLAARRERARPAQARSSLMR